ncbi:hypothetical protein Bsel_1929 [[Bacillus] selenitireducens MLS10]|uniref:Uncharacterized protein n=2 Tax=Salisediminibacterium selenitireducens TaxID=85683 RepID=D6XUE7_BACIE|nr:hypothetical protein Bsel_1929 [[Bacillus] selenitireducens MLS10]
MKPIRYEDHTLFTEARLHLKDEIYMADRMIIDTCAPHTKLSLKKGKELGLTDGMTEMTFASFSIGPLKVSEFTIQFEDLESDGIVGLDFLKKTGAKINLDAMTISSSRT